MNTSRSFITFIILLFSLQAVQVYAGDSIEVIPLKRRSAEELIPLVQPLLDPSEALSGTGYQLIVRATPERLDEIRALVAQLDQAVKQLRISVRRAAREEIEREGAQANIVVIGSGGGEVQTRGNAIIRSTHDKSGERNNFQVTTLEGTPAFINTGEAFPVPTQSGYIVNGQPVVTQGIEYQQLNSGFYALARTNGDDVDAGRQPAQVETHQHRHAVAIAAAKRHVGFAFIVGLAVPCADPRVQRAGILVHPLL